jgi:hypothetical protein
MMGRAHKKTQPAPARNDADVAGIPSPADSGQRIAWRFGYTDDNGPWGLTRLCAAEARTLGAAMTWFESMKMSELFTGHPGKDYEAADLPNRRAGQRLKSLGLEHLGRISRLRVSGPGRLYGFRVGNVFHVLWWDPKHEVWPAQR